MGRQLSCAVLVAFAIGCGNPSRAPIDSNDGSIVVPDGPTVPGEFGTECTEHTDCESGYCVEPVGAHGGVCSRICNDDCPQDWECHLVHLPEADVHLCVPAAQQLCLACANDTECGGGACLDIDGGGRCAIPCSGQCPTGYSCRPDATASHTGMFCQPITNSCTCTAAMAGAMRSCSAQANVGGNPATCFGTQTCSASTGWSACTASTPAAETCDGVDNDCNFVIDDGVGGGTACNITNGAGTCVGVQQCSGSSGFTCVGQTPTAEKCDAIDNNCNGSVDETFVAAGLGSTCTAGTGACIRYGSQRCNSTQNGLVCSAVAGSPTTELCNQIDDDCDSVVDNGFKTGATALGNVCTAGLGVCARGGTYVCASNGASTTCSATANTGAMTTETCNYLDDNCDGIVDNGYRNMSTGFYDTDQNCGACGTNCTTVFSGASQAFGQCVVGTSPQCVMRCNNGYGNLNGSTLDGCEFQIDATAIYVSVADTTAIDDATCGIGPTGTGTGNHPCKSIMYGLMRSSLTGRTQVLVADGTYNEGVMLLNGKQVKGGYRSDTWERHLSTTSTVISGSTQSGNHDRTVVAASITSATLFEGFVVRGSFNAKPGGNSYAFYITGSGSNLTIKDNQIFGGRGGTGSAGTAGSNGATGGNGLPYSASAYDSFQTTGTVGTYSCNTASNRPPYGGSALACAINNTGGHGGGNNCTPVRSTQTSTNTYPAGAGAVGGGAGGGTAGQPGSRGYDADLQNHTCLIPVQGQNGLPMFGGDGTAGGPGQDGNAVAGCTAAIGSVVGNDWSGGAAPTGASGFNGGGGGGGGAGGGAHCINCMIKMNSFVAGPDILGGHGGGGAGGGCGGLGGGAGGAGGGTFGFFIIGTSAPTLANNAITLGTGGGGGSGGIGGAGGLGGVGTKGGEQGTQAELFCSGKGGRGGDGGEGGAGSGGGGGCGGSTFGIYSSGIGNPNYCGSNGNTTTGGTVGSGGTGGFSGGNSGGAGVSGVLQNCVAL